MAIIHRVRANGKGKTRIVELTPRRAIRLMCIECMGFNRLEIDKCTVTLCPLYPYRHKGKPQSVENKASQAQNEATESTTIDENQ